MASLQLYKASAGSGKTFTLALEYLKLLADSPESYRSILAVTFTNKATAEMKERILSQLYGIAYHLTDSQAYFDKLEAALPLSGDEIRNNCRKALHLILHDFSYFHVETIDSFFQMIVRNLAHELQLANGLNIELDHRSASEDAVDHLMERLDQSPQLIDWILDYISENIEDNANWDIRKKLKTFAANVFIELYQSQANNLELFFHDKNNESYRKWLKQEIRKTEENMKNYGKKFFDMLEEDGVDTEFKEFNYAQKSGAGYFNKLREGKFTDSIVGPRAVKMMADASAWPGGKLSKDRKAYILEKAESRYMPLMNAAEEERQKTVRNYFTHQCILKHYDDLRLLSCIHKQLIADNHEANRMLLAETPLLLNKLIQDSDAPFIFEKIGTLLKHIMIDEFQDTSRPQWCNFKPLLTECLSQNYNSLIVGDIKQSIYRWRNGDWGILKNIHAEHLPGDIRPTSLDTNYRSLGNIIEFNNSFFRRLIQGLSIKESEEFGHPLIAQIYEDVNQKVLPSHAGLGSVKVTLIHEKKGDSAENYQERTVREIKDTILEWRENGVSLNDMAILIRENKQIAEIAAYFSENQPDVPIVSAEAFKLSTSEAVSGIIDALRYLNDADDSLAALQLARLYQNSVLGHTYSWDELCSKAPDFSLLLPTEFIQKREALKLLPLFELIENIIQMFNLKNSREQEAYIFFFLDQVMDFLGKEPGDIPTFLTFWENKLKMKKIPAGKVDGVQVFSIHKAKGLEFKHVIIPFCGWQMTDSRTTLWTEPQERGGVKLPVVALDFNKDIEASLFLPEYRAEKQQQWIDNINLLYVAFTRPVCNMHIIGKRPGGEGNVFTVSDLLYTYLDDSFAEGKKDKDQDFIFRFGEPVFPQKEEKDASLNPLSIKPEGLPVKLESTRPQVEFKQSNKSRDFLSGKDGDGEKTDTDYRQLGIILHDVFAHIITLDDVDGQLQNLEIEGNIESRYTKEEITRRIHKTLENPTVREWFSSDWEVINECTLLQKENGAVTMHRPDRVMIRKDEVMVVDFKSVRPSEEHRQQVQTYMELLRQMGYPHVHGALCYLIRNRIIEVD